MTLTRELDEAIGRPFLERWARMNDCEEWMAERLIELEQAEAVRMALSTSSV